MPFPSIRSTDAFAVVVGIWLLYKVLRTIRMRTKTTKLRGPTGSSWLYGVTRDIHDGDSGALHESWSEQYGNAFQVPIALGSRRIVLFDPKAIAHFYSKETFGYIQNTFTKKAIANLIGKGLLYAEGESHRRQRKALTPAFSNAAIRSLTPVFYDSAYKVKTAWDAMITGSSSGEVIINVQKWMNCVSLDSIGIAGFGHDFGALEGRRSEVEELFDSFGSAPPKGISLVFMLLGPILPFLLNIPTSRSKLIKKLHQSMEDISKVLLDRSRKEKEIGELGLSSRSIMGTLLRAESADSELTLSNDEVLAQMKVLILAGYETTSISLTWALMELALHPEKQDKLRAELAEFSNRDPTYEEFTNGLPYLNGVVREILRLHPPLAQTFRKAAYDDVIPLSAPLTTATGEQVDRIIVAEGELVSVPIRAINRSEAIWGSDAKEFIPERWLDEEKGLTAKAKEVQGYHHLLSFVDGPRTCLGRAFALAEFKSVLTVLIRNYVFDMRDGPETKVDMVFTILPRPKVSGEDGYAMPMRVRRYEY